MEVGTRAGFVVIKNGKPVAFYKKSFDGHPTYSLAIAYLLALGTKPEQLFLRKSGSEEDYLSANRPLLMNVRREGITA